MNINLYNLGSECNRCGYDYCVCTNDEIGSETVRFGCTTPGCEVSKSFYMYGRAGNPRLTIQIVETDFGSTGFENVYIYIAANFVSYCYELDDDCTDTWYVACMQFIFYSNENKYSIITRSINITTKWNIN